MLYKEYNEKPFSMDQFVQPDAVFRGTPFWAWNTRLDKEMLLNQIEQFKIMGMGGFHMHPRTGLDTPYLSPEFMDCVRICHEKAKDEEMLTWLYDEDRWPSGYGGGMVTEDESLRIRYLIFSPFEKGFSEKQPYEYKTRVAATSHGCGTLMAKYKVALDNGFLTEYTRYEPNQSIDTETFHENEHLWYAYLEIGPDNPWYNNQAYCNTLDRKAFDKFIEVTHEKYYAMLGEDFGKSIPAIFSDEPQTAYRGYLNFAEEKRDVMMPFNEDVEETFTKTYGISLMDHLPELFWELPDGQVSQIRYWFHDHLGERFTQATFDVLGEWCEAHDLLCSGHLMNESSLLSQTISMGDAMRCYRKFGLPGIDMLCDRREFNTAKQAQSITRQFGKEGVLSEVYGVTNWDFDFRGHKLQGDWQAALGVTVRVHHLSHLSLSGEAKRDYPASIGYQSPWWQRYTEVENHFSRLNTVLTRGNPVVRIGVIHPVESYWLHFGPGNQTIGLRKQLDKNFADLTEWLITGLLDFDFVSESLLPEQEVLAKDSKLRIGNMTYDTIVLPGCETLRSSTLDILETFTAEGGEVLIIGDFPKYVDGRAMTDGEKERLSDIISSGMTVSWEREKIIERLKAHRDIDIHVVDNQGPNTIKHEINPFSESGDRTGNLIYQMREEQDCLWLFICNAFTIDNPDFPISQKVKIEVQGRYDVEVLNTITGEISRHGCICVDKSKTEIMHEFNYHDSLLLRLIKLNQYEDEKASIGSYDEVVIEGRHGIAVRSTNESTVEISEKVLYTLEEPNVLLLDKGRYRLEEGEWSKEEEILRLDNSIRNQLTYPLRMADVAQPWTITDEILVDSRLELVYVFESKIDIDELELAHEMGDEARFILNECEQESVDRGFYVDASIRKMKIGPIHHGLNSLRVQLNYNIKTNLEAMYLLGNFGVSFKGINPTIDSMPDKVCFGDLATQGFPFYGGNITYKMPIVTDQDECMLAIRSPFYRGAAVDVGLDDRGMKLLAYAPYEVVFEHVSKGHHILECKLYGNRRNTFGNLHSTDFKATYYGPDAWRSINDKWSYQYQLKPFGIMTPVKVYEI